MTEKSPHAVRWGEEDRLTVLGAEFVEVQAVGEIFGAQVSGPRH